MELVLMDTNEKSSAPWLHKDVLSAFGQDKVSVVNLFCDYAIPLSTGLLAIERKTPGDLLASIGDGRVFKQVETMAEEARFSFIVVHGSLDITNDFVKVDGRVTNWRSNSVRGAIRSIMLAGCPVEIVPGEYFIRSMREIAALCDKPDHVHSSAKRAITFRDITMSDAEREAYKRVDFLSALPGIGRKKAEALLKFTGAQRGEKWGSIADALSLISAWGLCLPFEKALSEHWGHMTVKRVREFIGLAAGEYVQTDVRTGVKFGDVKKALVAKSKPIEPPKRKVKK